ncbi:MAG: chitinase [Prevotellaceae bacterium]|nr:chitinase [Prevotellaceae bacterium]
MKSKVAVAVCCVLMLAQCATFRKNETQSWKSSRDSWNSSYSGTIRQGESSDAVPGKGPQPASATPKKPNKRPQPPKGAKPAEGSSSLSAAAAQGQHSGALFGGMISEEMWDELFPNRLGRRAGERGDFYSLAALVEAAKHFPRFLHEGSETQRRRELAAFLAHLTQETGGFRYLKQISVTRSYSVANKEYPPVEGKEYYGRGPMQLSYNYNYGQFSNAYFGDKSVLLNNPELLAADSVVSFGSAIWFWMTMQSPKPSCHDVMVGGWEPGSMDTDANRLPGFGLTLNIINASQCGKKSEHAQKRYDLYERYCTYFGVTKGDNCECTNQLPYGKKSF